MKKQNRLIVAAVVFLSALPLWLVPHLDIGTAGSPDGRPAKVFQGADDRARQAIGDIAPDYKPWFSPLLEPASAEIASLLFALQAAIGAGFIGYWLGCAITRENLLRRGKQGEEAHAD